MMNKYVFILSLLISGNLFGQSNDGLFVDNNPKVNYVEAKWLNEYFNIDSFDFTGKYINFIELSPGGFWGIGKWTFPLHKKHIDSINLSKISYRLFILDSSEKKQSRGYDALLVIAKKTIKGKLRRLEKVKALRCNINRYPQIPPDAGIDTNSTLSLPNAIFFNELYKAELYSDTSFDFRGKKVAIFNTHCQYGTVERVNIPEYVNRIKSQLDKWGFSVADWKYELNSEEKKDTGGYDLIIKYTCKKDLPFGLLVQHLKMNNNSNTTNER